ncbi:MAG: hypothetical protein MUE64_09395 [Ignavibacteriaceae bacterium]|nr:hypothetical protein [Ignavibacteriaceae bacterium]
MKTTISLLTFFITITFLTSLFAQNEKNKGIFQEEKDGFYKNEIEKSIDEFNEPEKEKKKEFKLDFSGMDLPKSKDEFTSYWHNDPVSQGRTGSCWCFSTTSYFELSIGSTLKKQSTTFNSGANQHLKKDLKQMQFRGSGKCTA